MKGPGKIKNYTTAIPAEQTISEIEMLLVQMGASGISKKYEDGELVSIIFSVKLGEEESHFALPAKPHLVKEILQDLPKGKSNRRMTLDEQAKRTAWRILFNWVEVQVAMVQLNQADAMEVFMPYMIVDKSGKRFYEKFAELGVDASKKLLSGGVK